MLAVDKSRFKAMTRNQRFVLPCSYLRTDVIDLLYSLIPFLIRVRAPEYGNETPIGMLVHLPEGICYLNYYFFFGKIVT